LSILRNLKSTAPQTVNTTTTNSTKKSKDIKPIKQHTIIKATKSATAKSRTKLKTVTENQEELPIRARLADADEVTEAADKLELTEGVKKGCTLAAPATSCTRTLTLQIIHAVACLSHVLNAT
jgi:hypothetical protein